MKQLIAGIVGINDVDESGCTALYWAVHKGAVDCVRVLLESKADVNKANDDRLTPLHKACWNGDVECVKVRNVWFWVKSPSFLLDSSWLHTRPT